MRAIVIDPDLSGRPVLRFLLTEAGFDDVALAAGVADGLGVALGEDVDLVVVRAILPDGDGPALSAELRAQRYRGAIIVLSGQADTALMLRAFAAGADDFFAEPVMPQEFVVRVHAITRRYSQHDRQPLGTILTVGEVQLSVADLTVQIARRAPVRLTPTELRLLEYLMRNREVALSRERLIERVWGFDFFGESNRVDVYIRRLRSKIERDPMNPVYLQTIRGVGYVFRSSARGPARRDDIAPVPFTDLADSGGLAAAAGE